jgi:hypothetical protein
MPSIRPWQRTPIERLATVENALLETVNHVLAGVAAAPLTEFRELFSATQSVLTTFPELDHYGARTGENYVGSIYSTPRDAMRVDWPAGRRGPRLLAYLRPKTLGLDAALVALRSAGTVVACVPGMSTAGAASDASCQVYSGALQLGHLLPDADLLVTNGNVTTSSQALLAGVPVLALPNMVEQNLGALRIAQLGAGLAADGVRSRTGLRSLVDQVLQPGFRAAARRFAASYASETPLRAAARAASIVEAAAQRASA